MPITLTLDNASIGLDKAGHDVAKAGDVHGAFDLHGVGKSNVVLSGFRGTSSKTSSSISFSAFEATLVDTSGKVASIEQNKGGWY